MQCSQQLEGAFVCGPVRHPELLSEPAFEEELVLATPPGVGGCDAIRDRRAVKIVVLRSGCSYRQRLEEMLARRGVVGLRRLEFGTIDAVIGCVGAGLGVTLMPRAIVEPARRAGRVAVHALPPSEAQVETVFIRRYDGFVSSALAAFLGHARPALAQAAA